jgi:excisionase family DNA binding protein
MSICFVYLNLYYEAMEGVLLVGVLDERFAELPENLTIEQLAEVLGVKRATAYQWLNRGVVPAYKLGGTWIIYRDEVREHLIKSRNIQAPTEAPTEAQDDAQADAPTHLSAEAVAELEQDPQ